MIISARPSGSSRITAGDPYDVCRSASALARSAIPLCCRLVDARAVVSDARQAVVEFAIILPVFLLFVLMAIDFGRLFFTYIQVSNAAREAANYGAVQPTDTVGMQAACRQEKNAQAQGEGALDRSPRPVATPAGTTIACARRRGWQRAPATPSPSPSRQPFSFLTPLINHFFGGALPVSADASTAVLGSAVGGGDAAARPARRRRARSRSSPRGLDIIANPAGSSPTAACATSPATTGTSATARPTSARRSGDTTPTPAPAPTSSPSRSPTRAAALTAIRTRHRAVRAADPDPVAESDPDPRRPDADRHDPPTPTPTATPCTAPVANFTWTTGSPRRNVTFTDASTAPAGCPITNWLWDVQRLRAGPPIVTNAQNPFHAFPSNNGNHSVTPDGHNSAGSVTVHADGVAVMRGRSRRRAARRPARPWSSSRSSCRSSCCCCSPSSTAGASSTNSTSVEGRPRGRPARVGRGELDRQSGIRLRRGRRPGLPGERAAIGPISRPPPTARCRRSGPDDRATSDPLRPERRHADRELDARRRARATTPATSSRSACHPHFDGDHAARLADRRHRADVRVRLDGHQLRGSA